MRNKENNISAVNFLSDVKIVVKFLCEKVVKYKETGGHCHE